MITVIGFDPGPTSGVCALYFSPDAMSPLVYSCNDRAAVWLIERLLGERASAVEVRPGVTYQSKAVTPGSRVIMAVEAFAPGHGAGARVHGGEVRNLISEVQGIANAHGVLPLQRTAAAVKPWATDKRLQAAGLYALCAKMTDARDACRHALFAAVHDGGLPDPLDRRLSVGLKVEYTRF